MEATQSKPKYKNKAVEKWITAAGGVLCALLGAILLCNLILIIQGALSPERPPSVLGVTPMVVLSGSMSGEQDGHLETGDLVLVKKTDPDALKVGDVIAYMSGNSTITHRITAIETAENGGLLFTTKGDVNNAPDIKPVSESELVGLSWIRIPKLGDFALFLQQPLGIFLFIGVPLFSFLAYDSIRRRRHAMKETQRAQQMEAELTRLRSITKEGDLPSSDSDSLPEK